MATLVHFWEFCPKTQKGFNFMHKNSSNLGNPNSKTLERAYFEAGPVELSVEGNLKNMKRSMAVASTANCSNAITI